MKKSILYLLMGMVISLAAVSCQTYDPGDEGEPDLGNAEVGFEVNLPEEEEVNTRAWSDTDIDNIDLLVFNQTGSFIGRVEAYDITGTGNSRNFKARLDLTNNARIIYVVANGRQPGTNADRVNFSSIAASQSHTTAIPALVTNMLTATTVENIMPLIMWGRVQVNSITSTQTIAGFKLLRSQACIQVKVAAPNATNGLDKFSLTSFSVHNTAAYGKVAPASYTSSAAIPTTPNAVGVSFINYYTNATTGYWAPASNPVAYVYERTGSTTTNYTSLIIRGTYNGKDGYYKVVMHSNEVPINIVRSHRYIVNIIKADGAGYATPEEAAANGPSNALKIQIQDAREDIKIVIANGSRELGLSNDVVMVHGTSTANTFEVAKVYMSNTAGRKVTFTGTGLTAVQLSAPDVNNICTITAKGSGVAGTGTIVVTDGVLSHTINVSVQAATSNITNTTNTNLKYLTQLSMTASHQPWSMEVVSGSQYVWLHTGASQVSSYGGGTTWTGSYDVLESRTSKTGMIFVHGTAAVKGAVKYSYKTTGGQVIGRLVFNR